MPVRITAAICTYNRADLLPVAIRSLLNQTLPPEQYEVLVINNNSGDTTAVVVAGFSAAPNFRCLVEPRLGLCHARNTAVQAAAGEIIAFLDDDAIAAPGWLAALLETYAAFPEAWAVGGKVEPVWLGLRPAWLGDDLLPQLSMLDLGEDITPLAPPQSLYGVNCSFRREVFAETGLFRHDLGRNSHQLMGSEESELQVRIYSRHKLIIYTPAALVRHQVTKERLRRRYFIRLAYYKGKTQARLLPENTACLTLVRRIGRGGLGIIRQWLRLGLYPFNQQRQLQCVRVTAHWFGFTQEIIRRRLWKNL